MTTKSSIASFKYTSLKHAVPGKLACHTYFIVVTVTFNHADVLKLTGALVHSLLFINAIVWWLLLTALH